MGAMLLTQCEEAELARQSKTDTRAFSRLYDAYFYRVYGYVYVRVGDRAVTDDLVSTIFLRAIERIDGYQEERGEFGPWLFRIAHNAVVDYYRRNARTRQREVPLEEIVETLGSRPTERQTFDHLSDAELLAHVARLDARAREIIALKFAAGLGNKQIAALLGLNDTHVAVILYRAMKQLRRQLMEDN